MQRQPVIVVSESEFYAVSTRWLDLCSRSDYAHGLTFFGEQIFQVPTDIYLYQKLIWEIQPTLIIETGVAKGGSILAIASFRFLAQQSREFRYSKSDVNDWLVIGIDKNDLTKEREMLSEWSFGDHVRLIEGSSTDIGVVDRVKILAHSHKSCLIFLDSDHSESHVAQELEMYSRFVSIGSYLVVFDSGIGRLSDETHAIRPRGWNKSSHAGVAVSKFIESQNRLVELGDTSQRFVVDTSIAEPLGISSIEGGVLKRVS